jgi:transposase
MARMLTADPHRLDDVERNFLGRLFAASSPLALAQTLALRFVSMVQERTSADFDGWQTDARGSELQAFANGLHQDETAVKAALSLPWSNGQTERQVNRLKLIKRQMYGRAKFDLLRTHVLKVA